LTRQDVTDLFPRVCGLSSQSIETQLYTNVVLAQLFGSMLLANKSAKKIKAIDIWATY